MRLPASKPLRVRPGDEVLVRARLSKASRLGRLFIFAREGEETFSPYVPGLSALPSGDEPRMMSPISLRLAETQPSRSASFVSDIDGYVCVMQEVDSKADLLAKVSLRRKINPALPWTQRAKRTLTEMFA